MMKGKVNEGSKAPMFTARDVRGSTFNSSGYLGRSNLVLFFYRNSKCSTCISQLKELKTMYDRIAYQDSEVIAISNEGQEDAIKVVNDLGLSFPVISDRENKIIDDYGIYDVDTDTAYPALFIIDKTGIVRFKKLVESIEDRVMGEDISNRLRKMDTGLYLGEPHPTGQ